MKTARDVVENFGGVWPFPEHSSMVELLRDQWQRGLEKGALLHWDKDHIDDSDYRFVCTKEQFEEEARKMNNEQWLTGPDGKQYQKGAVYEFSDDGDEWVTGLLVNIDNRPNHYRCRHQDNDCEWFAIIRECQAPIGKIKAPEIVPEDGYWYLCATLVGADSVEVVMMYQDGFLWLGSYKYPLDRVEIIKKVDV